MNSTSVSPRGSSRSIGVVVPVYRVEPFVAETIASLAQQIRRPDQIVLVDDRGGDDSMGIALKAAAEHGLVVDVIDHERNRGLAAARNSGLNRLDTDLVWFFDSDDLADRRFLSELAEAVEHHDASFAMCRTALVDPAGAIRDVVEPSWADENTITGEEFARRLLANRVRGYACNKLFRRDLLGDAPFPEGVTYEDIGPALHHGLTSRTVALVDTPLYHYRDNDASISRRFGAHTVDLLAVDGHLRQALAAHGRHDRAWRELATVFRYEGSVLPVANMAARALDADPDPATAVVARSAVAEARAMIRWGDLVELARARAWRLTVPAAVLAVNAALYRRILRHR